MVTVQGSTHGPCSLPTPTGHCINTLRLLLYIYLHVCQVRIYHGFQVTRMEAVHYICKCCVRHIRSCRCNPPVAVIKEQGNDILSLPAWRRPVTALQQIIMIVIIQYSVKINLVGNVYIYLYISILSTCECYESS